MGTRSFSAMDRLFGEIDRAIKVLAAPAQSLRATPSGAGGQMQQVINDLQALRGIADISAVTIAAELG